MRHRASCQTMVIPWIQFLSPLSSAMIAPASGQIAEKFGIKSDVIVAMVTSIFVAAYTASRHLAS